MILTNDVLFPNTLCCACRHQNGSFKRIITGATQIRIWPSRFFKRGRCCKKLWTKKTKWHLICFLCQGVLRVAEKEEMGRLRDTDFW